MGREADRFSAGESMAKTVYVRSPDFTTDLQLDVDSYNVTSGILIGLGPRNGFATIPGQNDSETISGTRYPGIQAATGSPAQGFTSLLKVLAVVPISLGTNTTPSTKINTYLWIVTRTGETIDFCIASTTADISANIYDGLAVDSANSVSSLASYFFGEAIPAQAASRTNTFAQTLAYTSGKYYASTALLSVSGGDVPMQWYFGQALTTGDGTHAPDLTLQKCVAVNGPAGTPVTINCGVPSFFNLQNYPLKGRSLNIYTVLVSGASNTQYFLLANPTSSIFLKDVTGANTTVLDIDGIVVQATPVAGTPANTNAALVEDAAGTHNTSYKAALVASKKPFACIFQDSYSASTHHKQQWVDLTSNSYQPPLVNSNTYVEEGIRKQSCFNFWPEFIRGTAMTNFGGVDWQTVLGAANSGILRANTAYEFTYSVYNKRLNFETNVGTPVKFQVGATDFCSLNLFYSAGGAKPVGATNMYSGSYGLAGAIDNSFMPFAFSDFTLGAGTSKYTGSLNYMNFTQYRFYYRQEGTFEWLPALQIDASKFWFFNTALITACNGAIAALPGGQPGAFVDYSTLPMDTYDCVVSYKDRAWWFSEKAINFSLRNNVFAYPARNSINAASGSFRGGIVHNYPGQAEQSSRLVIFGTTTTYVARFTGLPSQTQVQVSADTSATFNIDGSDLVIDPWTSATAFSYRAAVVADGILFWWGPEGIYRDDGVATPTKISTNMLEPDLFTFYDPNKIDEIHASYNAATKEITWCYPPKTADGYATHTIIYNVESQGFLFGKTVGKVDWISELNVQSNIGTAGKRMVACTRSSASGIYQQPYFYDQNNRAGDIYPSTDFLVKQISTPSTGLRRLTLAAGYGSTNFNTIAVGDRIALQQVTRYAASISPASDMVATVAAVGAGTIDITLPTGASLDTGTLTFDEYFPIWHATAAGAGLNGFPWQIKTGYWMPEGVVGYFFWLYCYTMYGVRLWATDDPLTYSLAYRTPTSTGYQTDTITITDNSDGTCQVYHPLTIGEDNMEGQAIKLKLSGTHIGHEWLLQYLEQYARPIDGDPLLRFEG